jgi:hypothetical protein
MRSPFNAPARVTNACYGARLIKGCLSNGEGFTLHRLLDTTSLIPDELDASRVRDKVVRRISSVDMCVWCEVGLPGRSATPMVWLANAVTTPLHTRPHLRSEKRHDEKGQGERRHKELHALACNRIPADRTFPKCASSLTLSPLVLLLRDVLVDAPLTTATTASSTSTGARQDAGRARIKADVAAPGEKGKRQACRADVSGSPRRPL